MSNDGTNNAGNNDAGANNQDGITDANNDGDLTKAAAGAGADGGEGGENQIAPMPEHGHDKYYNKQTGEYNYKAHMREEAYNKGRAKETAKGTGVEKAEEGGQGADESNDILAKAGITPDQIGQEIADFGNIADSTKEALVKVGLDESLIKNYESGIKAQIELRQAQVLSEVGGAENLQVLHAWINSQDDGTKATIYEGLGSDGWKMSLQNVMNMMGDKAPRASRAYNPFTANGSDTGARTQDTMTQTQFAAAVRSKEYATDPAYKQWVDSISMGGRVTTG